MAWSHCRARRPEWSTATCADQRAAALAGMPVTRGGSAELLPGLYRAAADELAGIAEMVTPDRSVGGRRLARGVLLWAAWM